MWRRTLSEDSPGSLTRADIAEAVHRNVKMSRAESLLFVESIMEHIARALERGENVKITHFGTFVLNDKGERVGRNPKTLEEVTVSARRVVTFRASGELKDRVAGL
ncbi:integration host factor subunit alpha [Novosphingobium sp. ST904]|nr:integration host factor subunit alpha [Novosphingobium sp. ST904]